MKSLMKMGLLIIASMLLCYHSKGGTNLIPGLVLNGGFEHLSGKLIFLTGEFDLNHSNSEKFASIYEFDLAKGAIEKITNVPSGTLVVSDDGYSFCVISYADWRNPGISAAKVYVYAKGTNNWRIVDLIRFPRETVVLRNHIFFVVDGHQSSCLIHYDVKADSLTEVVPQSRSIWCRSLHRAEGRLDVIHFVYSEELDKLKNGDYSYDISSGNLRKMTSPCLCKVSVNNAKTTGGQYVFLRGRDSPLHGSDVVLSSIPFTELFRGEINGPKVKMIKRFPTLKNGDYTFHGLDPSRRYALVVSDAWISRWFSRHWLKHTYYAVNVIDGSTSVIVVDGVAADSSRFVRDLKWVP